MTSSPIINRILAEVAARYGLTEAEVFRPERFVLRVAAWREFLRRAAAESGESPLGLARILGVGQSRVTRNLSEAAVAADAKRRAVLAARKPKPIRYAGYDPSEVQFQQWAIKP